MAACEEAYSPSIVLGKRASASYKSNGRSANCVIPIALTCDEERHAVQRLGASAVYDPTSRNTSRGTAILRRLLSLRCDVPRCGEIPGSPSFAFNDRATSDCPTSGLRAPHGRYEGEASIGSLTNTPRQCATGELNPPRISRNGRSYPLRRYQRFDSGDDPK